MVNFDGELVRQISKSLILGIQNFTGWQWRQSATPFALLAKQRAGRVGGMFFAA